MGVDKCARGQADASVQVCVCGIYLYNIYLYLFDRAEALFI